jgi:type VI secretion system protein ImpA
MELEQLIAETAEDPPCGPNLEYDAAFLALEQQAQGKPEQQFGDTVIAAEEPQWDAVRQAAVALLARSKDVRVAVYLVRALLSTDGLAGLNVGLKLVHQLLDRYWDCVHPQLDPDDDNDPTMRLNALAPLVDSETMLRELRRVPFIRSRTLGQVLVRDVEVALGKLPAPPDGPTLSQDQVESMARAAATENPEALEAVREAAQTLRGLHGMLVEKLGGERALDVRPLASVLSPLVNVCNTALSATAPTEMLVADEGGGAPGAGGAPQLSGEVRTREDAIRLLDRVCDFLERQEPTNPAPLLIRRAKRLMTMSFVDIINDMAPESLVQVRNIAGIRDE